MKLLRILALLLALLIPVVARFTWFYAGTISPRSIATPDYARLKMSAPPVADNPEQEAEVDTSARPTPSALIVVDGYHSNVYLASELDPFLNDLATAGGQVRIYDGSRQLEVELKQASAFVVILPSLAYQPDEVRAIITFVARGGRVLSIGDPTRNIISTDNLPIISGSNVLNQITAPFGIHYNNDYVYNLQENDANFRNVILTDFTSGPLSDGLNKVIFYTAQSLQADQSLIRSGAGTLSSLTDRGDKPVVAATAANGRVIALGDLNFLTEPWRSVADNARLSANIAAFLVGDGEHPTPSLETFPYIFSHPVTVLAVKKPVLNGGDVTILSALQKFLQTQDLEMKLGGSIGKDSDLIVLGTYENLRSWVTYSGGLKISVEETGVDPTMISVKIEGLGSFNAAESGLIILSQQDGRIVLVLAGQDETALGYLASRLMGYGLADCLIFANTAVCPTVGGNTDSDG